MANPAVIGGGILILCIIIGVVIWFFTRKKEGDECDPIGDEKVLYSTSYEYDSDGKCAASKCLTDYTLSGGQCVIPMPTTTPTTTPECGNFSINADGTTCSTECIGNFKTNDDGTTCSTTECVSGYNLTDGQCEEDTTSNTEIYKGPFDATAYVWPEEKVYFFKDKEYWTGDIDKTTDAITNYEGPNNILDKFPGIPDSFFPLSGTIYQTEEGDNTKASLMFISNEGTNYVTFSRESDGSGFQTTTGDTGDLGTWGNDALSGLDLTAGTYKYGISAERKYFAFIDGGDYRGRVRGSGENFSENVNDISTWQTGGITSVDSAFFIPASDDSDAGRYYFIQGTDVYPINIGAEDDEKGTPGIPLDTFISS